MTDLNIPRYPGQRGPGTLRQNPDDTWSALVAATGNGFKISQAYVEDITMDGTVQIITLPTGVALGAGRVQFWNKGATTEIVRFAFLTGATDTNDYLGFSATYATTGIEIPAYADAGALCLTDPLGVPALATHIAICNGVTLHTQVVQYRPGV